MLSQTDRLTVTGKAERSETVPGKVNPSGMIRPLSYQVSCVSDSGGSRLVEIRSLQLKKSQIVADVEEDSRNIN